MNRSCGDDLNLGVLVSVLMLILAVWLLAPAGRIWAQEYETPPVLEASEVLPSEMQRGDRFVVQEQVRNDGFMNYYVVESDFGQFEAYGNPALAKLIQEIGALDQLDEVSKSKVFADSVKKSATGQVEAVQQFADKPVETVKGVPGGLKRSFKKYKRDAGEGYETAKDVTGVGGGGDDDEAEGDEAEGEGDEAGSDDDEDEGESDEESSSSEDAKELAGKTTDAAEAYAKKWFGVGAAERRWHEQLGTDPYTTNAVLRKRIKELSKVAAATNTGMRFAPIPRIPGARELHTLNQIVWSVDPRELREQNIKRLVEAGVDEELIEQFINNPWFSPTGQTILLTALLEMEGVEGRRVLLEIASTTESAEEAQFDLGNIMFLGAYHRSVKPIARLLPGRVAVAITQDGDMLKIVSVDYAFWQQDLAGAVTTFVEAVANEPATTREIWLRGKASSRFQEELDARGWTVHEAVELDPRARVSDGSSPNFRR